MWMHSSLLKVTVALNSALLFWIPVVFGDFLCSMSALLLKIVLMLDALQLLMLCIWNKNYVFYTYFIAFTLNY
jgi:hypothetical protein